MSRRAALGQSGSATVELVLLTPLLVLLALVAVAFGRATDARLRVEDAAHDAARAASLAYTPDEAERAARQAATAALPHDLGCTRHTVHLIHDGLEPGTTVTAEVACHASLAGLSATGLPGTLTLHAASTSPVDTYRSRP